MSAFTKLRRKPAPAASTSAVGAPAHPRAAALALIACSASIRGNALGTGVRSSVGLLPGWTTPPKGAVPDESTPVLVRSACAPPKKAEPSSPISLEDWRRTRRAAFSSCQAAAGVERDVSSTIVGVAIESIAFGVRARGAGCDRDRLWVPSLAFPEDCRKAGSAFRRAVSTIRPNGPEDLREWGGIAETTDWRARRDSNPPPLGSKPSALSE